MFLYSNSTVSGRAQSAWQKLAITGCTSLRQGAVDGRHVIEALKIICSRMRLTLKAGECRYRESFVIFLIAQKLGRVSPHSMLSTQEATPRATILVVDDSPDMLRYLRMVLELDSYRVETAYNGVEALQRVSNGTFPA